MSHPPHNILVIEDELAMREILRDALAEEGHRVVLAADGQEGLDRLRVEPQPCVVLLDLLMPRLNGWQVASRMRSDPAQAHIPVVFITANPRNANDAMAMKARWLGKPLDLDHLYATVDDACAAAPDARSPVAGPPGTG